MMLMMQNLASNPKISCSRITDEVMMMGFLYLMIFSSMVVRLTAASAGCAGCFSHDEFR